MKCVFERVYTNFDWYIKQNLLFQKKEESCSIPRWENLPSGHQRYPLFGINLGYMYWGQKHISE